MKLQIALDDITREAAKVLLEKIQEDVDIIEIGTPFAYYNDISVIQEFKNLGIETVDLAFLPNIPSMVQVVEGIINEMAIEEVILACEIKEMSPDLDKEYAKHWPEKAKLSYIPHIEFDEEIKKVKPTIHPKILTNN